jgi:2-oxoisovalerate dehydrogenase E2 component (dihydrolipoyl transacylase)
MKGSGKHGRILKEDILDFKDKPQNRTTEASSKQQPQTAAPPAGVRVVKMNPIMQGMVKSMNHAATVPHFYLKDEFDITRLVPASHLD